MKHFLRISLFLLMSLASLHAQETIYLANGNRLVGHLTGMDGEKVKIMALRDGKQTIYALRRENVLLVFGTDGRFIIVGTLDTDPVKAQQEIDAFHQAPAPYLPYDLLLRTTPPTVIAGMISYESDDVVNYKSSAGAAASINKRDLTAIIYHTGRHRLLMPPAAVVTTINSVRTELLRLTTAPPPVARQPAKVATAANISVAKTGPAKPVAKAKPALASVEPSPKPEVISASTSAVSVPAPPVAALNDAQYQQYRASAIQRVNEFVTYLNIVTDKDLDDDKKDKAIQEATALFMPDATIDVTSTKRPGIRKYKIEDYLKRLKLVPYASTSIEWSEIQYVSELKQEADGNYYGMITGQQTFTGYAENGQDVLYSDVTQKSVKVKLEAYRKSGDNGAALKWAVLLGNIGLVTK